MAYKNGSGGSKLNSKADRTSSGVFSTPKPSSSSVRPKAAASAAGGIRRSKEGGGGVPGRVRVALRLRPRNAAESAADSDFADCVELQPEIKRLKLRKNNWDTDTYEFDEVLTEFASQKRVYESVAKPVVEFSGF